MSRQIEESVVRIHKKKGGIAGAGFLISDTHILTCAHVVATALNTEFVKAGDVVDTLFLDFPLIAPDQLIEVKLHIGDFATDIAVLKSLTDLPMASQPTSLRLTRDVWGHTFRAFGFPENYTNGVWATGIIRGAQAHGWLQIEGTSNTGYRIQPGFSGTPVWDEQLGCVLGIVTTADAKQDTKAAFIIPASQIAKTWPDIFQDRFKPENIESLQYQLEKLLEAQGQSESPQRFQPKIQYLQTFISNWDQRLETQQSRIASGLHTERAKTKKTQVVTNARIVVIGNPPQDVSGFFKDREQQQKTLAQLLAEPATKLISIIGQGGMGKTALASKVLNELEQFRWPHTEQEIPLDGIVYLSTRTTGISLEKLFLDCAKLLSPTQEQLIIDTWNNPTSELEEKISALLGMMSQGLYVVLLDNLEDLLDDHGEITDPPLKIFFQQSLRQKHGIRLLVTTRIPLAFQKEVLRYDHQVKLLEGLPETDAIALLRELDPNGDFGIKNAPHDKLEIVVKSLHGVPRALEVLTGILANDPFLTLDDVLADYYHHDDVVQTLIKENYMRLDVEARFVMDAMSIYRRPVPVVAIDFLLAPFAPGLNVPAILQRLARANIVQMNRSTKTITLHPIDQDFVYSQLPNKQEMGVLYTSQALERQAALYYQQIRKAQENWHTIEDIEPQLLEYEHLFRAADFDEAYLLTEPISFNALFNWGYYDRLASLWEKLLGHISRPDLQTAHLGHLGIVYRVIGKYDKALKLTKEALAIAEKIGSLKWQGAWLNNLGIIYRDLGSTEEAVHLFEQSFERRQLAGDYAGQVQLLSSLGNAYHRLGQTEDAIRTYKRSIELAEEINHKGGADFRLLGLGRALLEANQFSAAQEMFAQALALEIPHTNFRAALALAIAMFCANDNAALNMFVNTIERCEALLEKDQNSYQVYYHLATALVGYAICNSGWQQESQRTILLKPALQAYQQALYISKASGILFEFKQYLKLLRNQGVQGLNPIQDLLDNQ